MRGLAWNWLSLPYAACALVLLLVAIVAALVRGDRVLRLGTIGAATTAVPWALCSATATFTDDPETATRLLRLGNGPIALVGPSLLLVLLGVSGQLERHRWIARIAGALGFVLLVACWATDWTIAGVHRIPAGTFYSTPGPLTSLHFLQLAIWLGTGIVIARRSTSGGERRRLVQMLVGVLALGTVGATDLLLVYDVAGFFPVAWLSAGIAGGIALYYELRSDLLRPQGFDRDVFVELVAFAIGIVVVAGVLLVLGHGAAVAIATLASLVFTIALGVAWTLTRDRPVRIARERALEQFVASAPDLDTEPRIAAGLAALWKQIAIELRTLYRLDGEQLVPVGPPVDGAPRALDADIATWLVDHGEVLAAGDLGTMRLGPLRGKLEQLVASGGATLIVPLIDRGTLVGLVEADHGAALREDERGLVVESSRTAARALTYLALARTAARERETAREVEVAEAMRLHASASRDDELGRWSVHAEYRSAARTTGAGWSATLLDDGRLAVLVTEAQAHGVPAALATAALTGAFAAATTSRGRLELDELLLLLRASAEGVVRGGEPVAAFVAVLDADADRLSWATAGHPGAVLVGPLPEGDLASSGNARLPIEAIGGGGGRLGASLDVATRGTTKLVAGMQLVIASTALRGDDDAWRARIRELAFAGQRLPALLVEASLRGGEPAEDLLAVVVRRRAERKSQVAIAPA
ncbi:MAG TPA: SpoIIE family protein phosphatase [Kofleriaceae bacterium]|nr:SpoIIE family protein phosphatase [Kofleriaceae bacterium]